MALIETTPLIWLHCTRCGHPFRTPTIRGVCAVCADAAARHWPGVTEPSMEVGGE